jgi:hypothetical protein
VKIRCKKLLLVALAVLGVALFGTTQVLFAETDSPTAEPPVATPSNPFAGVTIPTGPELSLTRIEEIASVQAQESGTPNPSMSLGRGSLDAAMRTINNTTTFPESRNPEFPGLRAMLEVPVYLVIMQGSFTLHDALVPPGDHQEPVGSVLDLVIDAHTGQVVGRALPTPEQQQEQEAVSIAGAASAKGFIAVHKVRGVIAGTLYASGGPPRRVGKGPHGAPHFPVIVTQGSRVIARTTTTERGGFKIVVRPGHYGIAGKVGFCPAKKVVVRAWKETRTTIFCTVE